MQKVVPCLWFNGDAEEAAQFYVSLLPNSSLDGILKSPADTPSGPTDTVLTVEFTLAGMKYMGLNGGPQFSFTEAVSFQIYCDDQAESIGSGRLLPMAAQKSPAAGSKIAGGSPGRLCRPG